MSIEIKLPDDYIEFAADSMLKNIDNDNTNGIYVLFDDTGRCLYVGQSSDLRSRLRTHLSGQGTAADFYTEIAKIRVYFVDNPYEREIYETFAITYFKGIYNRAKTYKRMGVPETSRQFVEDLQYDLEMAERRRADLIEELEAHKAATKKYIPRMYNPLTGKISARYLHYLEYEADDDDFEYELDEDKQDDHDYEVSLRRGIKDSEDEIYELKDKIRDIRRSFRTK